MIILNELENKKCTGFSYTFIDSELTININDKIEETLVYYHNSDNVNLKINCSQNGSVEIAEIFNKDYQDTNTKRSIVCEGIIKHIVFNFSSICDFSFDNSCITDANAKYDLIYLDFNNGNNNINNYIKLDKAKSIGNIHLASVVNKKFKKEVLNRIDNDAENTEAFMHNYGVSFDEGRLHIKGIGSISKGSSKAKTDQKSEMYLMDECSYASNEPILLIDEDNVEASHASAVGQIDENTIFYLCSRGLTAKAARRLVVLGEFKAFINLIKSQELKDMAEKYLNEVIHNV